MATDLHLPATPAPGERIAALDVVRGFALIGILLMNIEYFNRATADIGGGLQEGLTGANFWFSWNVQYFVVGKFWTIFSLLFGMGFGVMLMRAQAAQRSFLKPYLRRIGALALFGIMHYILVWPGDILFSYAVGAVALLVVLYGRALPIVLAMVLLAGLGGGTGWEWPFVLAACLAYFGLCAWYLRCPDRITLFGRSVPLFAIVTRLLMAAGSCAFAAGVLVPSLPHEARFAMPIIGGAIVLLAILMARYHDPDQARTWRMGVGLYVFAFSLMTMLSAAQYYYPNPHDALAAKAAAAAPASPAAKGPPAKELSAFEQTVEEHKKRAALRAEHKDEMDKELRVLTKGSYTQAVAMRARDFVKQLPEQVGFATV
ncbi:MAG: hypothetical protein WKG03_18825, partial [Telluria sp.]